MSIYSTRPITLTNLHTYPLSSRKSKVSVRDFAKPAAANSSLSKFLASLPNFLAAADLRNLLAAIHQARKQREPILSAVAYNRRIPPTVRLALGPAIPHRHRTADGAPLGSATHLDFRLFCSLVQQMHPGGIYLNWGSAVLLPEVFLKAVSVVRNLGIPLRPITTANFDFIQHYRPLQNVVRRPTASGHGRKGEESRGYTITGHHELLLPLIAAALACGWPRRAVRKRAREKR